MYHANNPFATDPNSNAQSRYPDISPSPDPSMQFAAWAQPMNSPQQQFVYPQQTGFPIQQQPTQFQQQQPPQFQQQQSFQPTSSFGQQMQQSLGNSYSYLQGQPTAQSPSQSSAYASVASFDPYANLGQLAEQPQQQQQGQQSQQFQQQPSGLPSTSPNGNPSPNGYPHPREYIRAHKAELEAWDNYAWKQALGSFEALQKAWAARRDDLIARANQMHQMHHMYPPEQLQMEAVRLKGLHKEAESNTDSVAASQFQMREVLEGYRQSGDIASKRRVRESSNAALQGLPDWPPQSF